MGSLQCKCHARAGHKAQLSDLYLVERATKLVLCVCERARERASGCNEMMDVAEKPVNEIITRILLLAILRLPVAAAAGHSHSYGGA